MILEGDERQLLVAYLHALFAGCGKTQPESRARDLHARLEKPSSRPAAIMEARSLCEDVDEEGAAWERIRRGVGFFLSRFERADPVGGERRRLGISGVGPGKEIVRRSESVPRQTGMVEEKEERPELVSSSDLRLLDLLDSEVRLSVICLRCLLDLWELPRRTG